MRRPRPSNSERLLLLKQLEQSQALDKRRRRLYNRKYRKSFFFVSIWAGRLIYIILFVVVSFLHDKSGSFRDETVINRNVESYINTSRRGSSNRVTTLTIETNFKSYTSEFGDKYPPAFNIGDTLTIERNIFNKPIYFTKSNWHLKYWIFTNPIYYYVILFLTLISLFFNDGLDRFTDKILLIIWSANIIAIAIYFLT
jgi:hypothetical protein